jgi:hypothetical protein
VQTVKSWLIFLVLCPMTGAHGQRVEVPVQPRPTLTTVELSHIRGYVADPIWARIPNAAITLQKKKAGVFVDVQSIESSSNGEFDFGKKSSGIYQLVASVRGFCQITLPIRVSEKGWPGLRIALPASASDTPSGYCEDRLKIERIERLEE